MRQKTMGSKWIAKDVELNHGVRYPTPTSPYVFLESLLSSNDSTHRQVGARAQSMLSNYISSFNPDTQTFSNSLEFLKTMAEKERNAELNFIEAKLNKLDSLKVGKSGSGKINEIKQQLLLMRNNPNAVNYVYLISLINSLLMTSEDFTARLKTLTDTQSKDNIKLRANLASGIQSLINNFTGQRSKNYLSYEEIIRKLTSEFIQSTEVGKLIISQFNKNFSIKSTPAETFATIAGLIQDALVNYILKHGNIKYTAGELKEEVFNSELNRLRILMLDFQNSIEAQSLLNLDPSIISTAKDMFGITFSEEQAQKNSHKKRIYLDNFAKDFANNQKQGFKKNLGGIKVVQKNKKASNISYLEELYGMLFNGLKGVHTGSENLATDAIYVVSLPEGNSKQNTENEKVINSLKELLHNINTSTSPELIAKNYTNTFQNINEYLKDLKQSFILHESTKFYLKTEQGKHSGFGGRKMNIFNYIDEAAMFGQFNPVILKFLAMNLATDSIGAANVDPLAYYLSIFAGLSMFDDFAISAKQATGEINLSNMTNIHLYRLQSMYFPTSYFLQMTYDKMFQVGAELQMDNSYSTTITVPTIEYYTEYANSGISMQERWEMVRKKAETNTKIKIAFGKSFLSLIQQLSDFNI